MSTTVENKSISGATRMLSKLEGEGEFITFAGIGLSLMVYLLGVIFNAPVLVTVGIAAMVAIGSVATVAMLVKAKKSKR